MKNVANIELNDFTKDSLDLKFLKTLDKLGYKVIFVIMDNDGLNVIKLVIVEFE